MAKSIDNSHQICRICLTNSDQLNLIFDNANNISQVIMSFADVQVKLKEKHFSINSKVYFLLDK